MKKTCLTILLVSFVSLSHCQSTDTIYLWPNQVPGETEAKHTAIQTDNTSGGVTRLTDVTNPVLVPFYPLPEKANGAAVIVCPGGGYSILAIDLEGYEVAKWLNELGYVAFVLQYRVPQKQEGALMDAQRAMRLVRGNSEKWNIDPNRIGVLGFSAGGSLCARISSRYHIDSYKPEDHYDEISSRPNFAILIYPAYLDKGAGGSLSPELLVDEHTPPMFLFATADDYYASSSLVMTAALRNAKVPVELHILPSGGHGYGLRPGKQAPETWPRLVEVWLKKYPVGD